MKVEEAKRRLTRFILLFMVVILGVGMVEFIITGEIVVAGLWLLLSPWVIGLYVLNLMTDNLYPQTRLDE